MFFNANRGQNVPARPASHYLPHLKAWVSDGRYSDIDKQVLSVLLH